MVVKVYDGGVPLKRAVVGRTQFLESAEASI